jgi:hypothetical protein
MQVRLVAARSLLPQPRPGAVYDTTGKPFDPSTLGLIVMWDTDGPLFALVLNEDRPSLIAAAPQRWTVGYRRQIKSRSSGRPGPGRSSARPAEDQLELRSLVVVG